MLLRFLLDPFRTAFVLHCFGVGRLPGLPLIYRLRLSSRNPYVSASLPETTAKTYFQRAKLQLRQSLGQVLD